MFSFYYGILLSSLFTGILLESFENRQAEEVKDHLIQDQDIIIANLKRDLQESKKPSSSTDVVLESSHIQPLPSQTVEYVRSLLQHCGNLKSMQLSLKQEMQELRKDFIQQIQSILSQVRQFARVFLMENPHRQETNGYENPDSERVEENNISNDFLSPVSSDSEALFVPRQSSDSFNTSPIPATEGLSDSPCNGTKPRKFDREQLLEKHKGDLKRKDVMHKMQIDTIIRSLARRHSRKIRPFLTPSPELFDASGRMENEEFLKTCIERIKYS